MLPWRSPFEAVVCDKTILPRREKRHLYVHRPAKLQMLVEQVYPLQTQPMRDHTKLRAFQLADELVIMVYRYTQGFPQHEHFGLRSQLRRCAISVPSNIVEGSARHSEADYLRFLDIAYGSARELEYQLSLANRLGYLDSDTYQEMRHRSVETGKVLAGLIRSLRR